jgi:tetratricopeptide (TPR) repeat protein
MRENITRGGNLVHLFIISASIIILLLYLMLVLNYTSASKNGLYIYAVDIASLLEQGNAAYDQGRSEEAIKYYDQALAIDPNSTSVLVDKGLALDDLDRS